MDESGLDFGEMFWLSDAESMARMITDKMGRIESYNDQVESTSNVMEKESRSLSSLKKLYFNFKYKFEFNLGNKSPFS